MIAIECHHYAAVMIWSPLRGQKSGDFVRFDFVPSEGTKSGLRVTLTYKYNKKISLTDRQLAVLFCGDTSLSVVLAKKRIEKRIDFTFLCCKFHSYGEPSITSHTPKRWAKDINLMYWWSLYPVLAMYSVRRWWHANDWIMFGGQNWQKNLSFLEG